MQENAASRNNARTKDWEWKEGIATAGKRKTVFPRRPWPGEMHVDGRRKEKRESF